MTGAFDAIVVGLGVMGSATAYELTRRGARVLGIDQFPAGHAFGSSHGESRIIRELYYEHPLYVPIVQRAYELWTELGEASGARLLHITGGLMLGPADGRIVPGARDAAIRHGLAYQDMTPDEVSARVPAVRAPEHMVGLWDARGGYVRADLALRAFHALAARQGACLQFGTQVIGWEADESGVTVETTAGHQRAEYLVLCAGPWIGGIAAGLELPLTPERQVLTWFDPPAIPDDDYAPDRFPIFICEYAPGRSVYGFPRLATGVKASIFHEGETVANPDEVRRSVDAAEVEHLRAALAGFLPALANAPLRGSTTCLFTNTPDSRFVIGFHPEASRVLVSSPCSGHGFKFAPAIGEINADLITTGRARFDLSPFALARFAEIA